MDNKRGKNKKGLSTIVVTLIIILLSLVAVGVVWGVVNNLIKSGSEGVDVNSKCLNINIEATAVDCVSNVCEVTMTRTGTMDDDIAGVKLVFKNATSEDSSTLVTIVGNIEPLVGKKEPAITNSEPTADTVEITPYFVDASGKEQICSQSSSFEF